jgi:hypothetical protein
MAEMGSRPDYQRLAAEVLGIHHAKPELARRLVSQALVLEDRRGQWRQQGARLCSTAPAVAGVYVLRDGANRALYVGKAVNIRRRLRAHFAERRWRTLPAEMARVVDAEWIEVGSELEALLREAELIETLEPVGNIQVSEPTLGTRDIPKALLRDVIVLQPSVETDSVELICATAGGGYLMQRTRRDGADLPVHASRLWRFFRRQRTTRRPALAPIVFSWLARRGGNSTRLDPHDARGAKELRARLATLFEAEELFTDRLVVR